MRTAKEVAAVLVVGAALWATEPNAATRRWWAHVTALSNDSLQGRNTGSEGYRKAAAYVVQQFERNGLKPAGEKGFYQTVPLHEVRFRADQSTVELARANGGEKLGWLTDISIPARLGTPETIDAPLVFAGSGETPADLDLKGKILVQLGGGGRGAGGPRNGIAGTMSIDTTGGPEPPRWPVQYAVQMTIADAAAGGGRGGAGGGLALRFNPASAVKLFEGSGHTYKELLEAREAQKPLPWFALPGTLKAHLVFDSVDLQSDNIVAALPG
ncbi:MAG TPA: hypothetical protein VHW24_01990, partial [Bryobacteraceae bacterium]|nr:hypothetical protein [Bryobacteraceae bacterium]